MHYAFTIMNMNYALCIELNAEGEEEFEVDAGHGAGEDREVVFVEEVVDGELDLEGDGAEGEVFL